MGLTGRLGVGAWCPGTSGEHPPEPKEFPVLYTILVIIAAIVLAVIVLNVIRSGGRTV